MASSASDKKRPGPENNRLSMSTENYLLSIFRLQESQDRLTLTQLADHLRTLPAAEGLGTSLPSVSAMIRRMAREGLVKLEQKTRGIVFTMKGRRSAESIVRRHRLAERMVVDLLDVELHKAHAEAHRLEHAISPELEQKIIAKLGDPKTCPFGHPIPGSGYRSPPDAVPLSRVDPGTQWIVDRVPEDDQGLLDYLVANRVIPGSTVSVDEAAPSRGVITLVCDGNHVAFSYDVGSNIWVVPLGS